MDVRAIGKNLFKVIFDEEKNASGAALYKFCRQKVKPEKFTLECRVDENNRYPFELLYDPSNGFFGRQHKLYRSFLNRCYLEDDFPPPEEMNVLLMGAKTGISATGPDGQKFSPGWVADHVDREIKKIKEIMTRAGVRNITVFPHDGVRATTGNVLREIADKRWDIVHFAGHSLAHKVPTNPCRYSPCVGCSFHEPYTDAGQLVFEQPEGTNPDNPYHGDGVCLWRILEECPNTKFIYFSSCRSGLDTILTQTVRHSEAIYALGFLWGVHDAHACAFAVQFYKRLFEYLKRNVSNPIAEAVWQTQKQMSVPEQSVDSLAPVLIS